MWKCEEHEDEKRKTDRCTFFTRIVQVEKCWKCKEYRKNKVYREDLDINITESKADKKQLKKSIL